MHGELDLGGVGEVVDDFGVAGDAGGGGGENVVLDVAGEEAWGLS